MRTLIGDARIWCGQFCYSLFPLGFLVKQWQGVLETLLTSENFLSLVTFSQWDALTTALGRLAWYGVINENGNNPISTPIGEYIYIYICNVCVGVRGIRVYVQVSTNLESPPIMGNWEVIGHLCLMDFILLRHIKNGLEPELGLGVRLCMRKVLGTPRHPLKTVTSLLVFFYVCLARLLV